MSNPIMSPADSNNFQEKQRNDLKNYLKRSSIIEEEVKSIDDRDKYKHIYSSGVKAVTSFNVKDIDE